jgi:hypothetical protein
MLNNLTEAEEKVMASNSMSRIHLCVLLAVVFLATSTAVFAQSMWRVPDDFGTIQEAVDLADPGDTIVIGEGSFCGAFVWKTLTIRGDEDADARIISCPGISPAFFFNGKPFFVGLQMLPDAAGSTIEHLTFDGQGWADDNELLAVGVNAPFYVGFDPHTANDLTIAHNRFLGGIGGLTVRGSGSSIHHNVFDGYTIDDETGIGGWGVDLVSINTFATLVGIDLLEPAADNSVQHNKFMTTVRDGVTQPWVSAHPEVTFVGIAADDQNGMLLRNNKFSIAPDSTGTLFGAGIIVSDELAVGASSDAVIMKNDGRGSEYMLIITLDRFGGTGNATGAIVRGNFGVNEINEVASDVENRSIKTLLECDEFGNCQ